MIDLQQLFDEPIIEQVELDPGYSGHASDVISIRTAKETVVARSFRGLEVEGVFWTGCSRLFGIDPVRVFNLEPLNKQLDSLSSIRVPQVSRKATLDQRQWAILEFIPGLPLESFRGAPERLLVDFGVALANIHSQRFNDYGSPIGSPRFSLDQFHTRVVDTLRFLADQFFAEDQSTTQPLERMCAVALQLPTPDDASRVLVDIDARQFMTDGQRITALVDTEAYVIAPRQFDFIGLEYLLDQREATAFVRGYASVLPVPELTAVRPVYRYLYRLFEVQDDMDVEQWLNWPLVFDQVR